MGVIPKFPDDAGRVACAMASCDFMGDGRSVGYAVPNEGDVDVPPTQLNFTAVALGSRRYRAAPGGANLAVASLFAVVMGALYIVWIYVV